VLSFRFVRRHFHDLASWPFVKPSIPRLSVLLISLLKGQILEDQNRVLRTPVHQLFRYDVTEVFGGSALPFSQPFEDSSNRLRGLSLCLSRSKPFLETFSGLADSPFPFFLNSTGNKQLPVSVVDSNDRISFVEINPYGMDADGVRHINGDRHKADKLSVPFDDVDAIDRFGASQHRLEVFGDGIRQLFSSAYCPDREPPVSSERCVSTSFANQEQRSWL